MLTIEFEEPSQSRCECCDGTTTRLTRFVYQDGGAFAVYFAQFSDNHPDRIVKMVVALGEWGEDSSPEQRRAFALDVRASEAQYQVMVTDADACPWRDREILGRVLDRAEALADPWLPEVFHITDHAVLEDLPLKAYLDAV
jgi:hypothetical protein